MLVIPAQAGIHARGTAIPLDPPSQAKGEEKRAALGFPTPFRRKGVAAKRRGDVVSAMRILVTGANGQVGHELLRALAEARMGQPQSHPPHRAARAFAFAPPFASEGGGKACDAAVAHPLPEEGGRAAGAGGCTPPREIIPATRSGRLEGGTSCEAIDLADFDGLTKALDRIAPDVIINAAAYTAVDRAEDEPELAQRINGDALGVLGAWAKQNGARVVHYSTDYVFDGSATRPYRETDATHPVSVYGRSKLAGEDALRGSGARHLIFRTAWVYAARGNNFLRTMLRLGAERDALRVVDDQIGAPTPARLIAEVTAQAIAQWSTPPSTGRGGATANARAAPMRSIGGMPTLDGTYHLVASGQTSWCGFARAIFEKATSSRASRAFASLRPSQAKGDDSHPLPAEGGRAQRGGMLPRLPRVEAIGTADYPTKAKRPAFSVLDTTKLRAAFGIELPDWQTALDEVIGELAGLN